MCGIAASIGRPGSSARRRRALDRLSNRGPDAADEWASPDGRVWLGHRRLSIIDLSDAGNQPMANADGTTWLVCNGEIYNAPELRSELLDRGHRFRSRSDNEVVLHAYDAWGEACIARLEGMFAFVLWDEARGSYFAARDRIGIKPLYWSQSAEGLHFASEAGALVDLLDVRPEPDPVALGQTLTLGYVPAPRSIWQGVQKLEPGHFLRGAANEAATPRRYWSPPDETSEVRSTDSEWAEAFEAVLDSHLLSDVPVGLFLSGGLDSSAIALGLSERGHKATALTLTFPDAAQDESEMAAATAAHLGLPHQTCPVPTSEVSGRTAAVLGAFDEPQGFGALVTMDAISRPASEAFKVVLSGDGGDELFGGYNWHQDIPALRDRRTGLLARGAMALPAFPGGRLRNWQAREFASRSVLHRHAWRVFPRLLPGEAEHLLAPTGMPFREEDMIGPLERHYEPRLPMLRALQRLDLATFCADSILPKVDRASMAHSLEVRVPFLDRRLVEWAFRRPIVPGEAPKDVLRRYLRGRTPPTLLDQPKRGFSLRTLQGFDWQHARRQIAEGPWVQDGYWSPAWKRFSDVETPGWQGRLWSLWLLDLWGRRWLRPDPD